MLLSSQFCSHISTGANSHTHEPEWTHSLSWSGKLAEQLLSNCVLLPGLGAFDVSGENRESYIQLYTWRACASWISVWRLYLDGWMRMCNKSWVLYFFLYTNTFPPPDHSLWRLLAHWTNQWFSSIQVHISSVIYPLQLRCFCKGWLRPWCLQ